MVSHGKADKHVPGMGDTGIRKQPFEVGLEQCENIPQKHGHSRQNPKQHGNLVGQNHRTVGIIRLHKPEKSNQRDEAGHLWYEREQSLARWSGHLDRHRAA